MTVSDFDAAAAALPAECFRAPPALALVLGSGWSDALEKDRVLAHLSYADVPGFGGVTVPGHAGEMLVYERHGRRIVAFCGRRHWYEGAGWGPVVAPVELARRMGCGEILLTNACGGVNPALRPGDFVVVADHVNLAGVNPLVGPHVPEWGERFPGLAEVYDKRGRDRLRAAANRVGARVMEGTYCFTSGPCYETPAEIRAYARLGVDVVGMSTVPEATFAHACGLRVAALAFVSNLAAGTSRHAPSHEEVMAAAKTARPVMAALIDAFIADLPRANGRVRL